MKIKRIAAVLLSFITLAQFMPVGASEPAYYRGEGMCISVIDSGFSLDHSAFTLTSGKFKHTKGTVDALAPYTVAGTGANSGTSFFVSDKIPFAYDYGDRDGDVYNEKYANGGNAMLSIAAGNAADLSSGYSGYVGTAPEAQLFAMKVYSEEKGGVSQDALRDAILDSVALGADVILINISVIGGLSYDESMSEIHEALKKAEESGIVVVCPAGDVLEYGKDSVFESEYEIVEIPTSAPDRGTVAWPGSDSSVLSVANAESNTIDTYCFTMANGIKIPYSDNNSVYDITGQRSFCEYFDGKTFEYVCVNGVGTPEDFAAVGDLTGKLALVDRGTISFSDKAKNAAAYGAVGVIVADNQPSGVDTLRTLTDLTDAPIPLILVSRDNGIALASAEDKRITVKFGEVYYTYIRVTPDISESSAFGTSADLELKPDVATVGTNVVYATADGGYSALSSTAAAAARIAGICACVKQKLLSACSELSGTELARTVKALVVGSASPAVQGLDPYYYSPRAQGGGVSDLVSALSADMTLTFDGVHKASLGDGLGRLIQFTVTAENLSLEERRCTLDAVIGSDGYKSYPVDQLELDMESEDALYKRLGYSPDETLSFIKKFAPFKNTSVSLSFGNYQLNPYAQDYSPYSFTLAPGEKRTFDFVLYIDKNEFETYSEVFENGFFVEGFVRLAADSAVCTAPFLGFCGEFSDASALDADLYDHGQPIFDERYIYRYMTLEGSEDVLVLGDVTCEEDEDMVYDGEKLYYSPKTDKYNSTLILNFALLRTVTDVSVTVTNSEGLVVSQKDHGTASRTYLKASTGMEVSEQLPLWNGRADDNFAYVYPDGKYTVTVSYRIPGSYAKESFSYQILLDTTAPFINDAGIMLEEYTCHLAPDITDNFEVFSVTVEDSEGNSARLEEDGRYNISMCTGRYIYIDASDRIGNRNVVRIKNPVYVGAEE